MPEHRSVLLEAPDRWLRVIADPGAPGWDGLRNGERLGWLHPHPQRDVVQLWIDGVLVGRLSDEIAAYYHPALAGLAAAGIEVWSRVNVVAVEDRYVLHDYVRPDALVRWTQAQLRS
ncbi:hypothetical protein HQQ81_10675 [Microbacteriaceae bacterium VKM Ac-2854]|nr:hypothetical protein [Microbacteriaceae bacterium VKM Ac-2854]